MKYMLTIKMQKLALLFFVLISQVLVAQNLTVVIVGPTNVPLNQNTDYEAEFYNENNQYTNPPIGGEMLWSAIGGTITWQNEKFCTVQWDKGGTGVVMFEYTKLPAYYYAELPVLMPMPVLPEPSAYIITENRLCGSTTVTRSGGLSPTADYDWWWQTSSSGTSTSLGNSASLTLTASGYLYLRSRLKASPYTWGSTSSGAGNFIVYPSAPAAPTIANNSGEFFGRPVSLSVEAVTGATAYKWYNSNLEEINGNSSGRSFNDLPSGSTTFYVSALSGPCESNKIAVIGTVANLPVIQVVSANKELMPNQSVTLGLNQSYSSYLWKNSLGENLGTTATQVITEPGGYTVTVSLNGINGSALSSPIVVTYGSIVNDLNFVSSTTINVPNVTDYSTALGTLNFEQASREYGYVDGLGKPLQSVKRNNSPSGLDVVQPKYYNNLGRETREYLPYVSSEGNGNMKIIDLDNDNNALNQFYSYSSNQFTISPTDRIANDSIPYRQRITENSPLERVLKQGEFGAIWKPVDNALDYNDKSTKYAYQFNSPQEVYLFKYNKSDGTIINKNYYSENQLYKTEMYDSKNLKIIEFKDLKERLICKKVQTHFEDQLKFASTYYLYDDFGNLVMVVPPEGVEQLKTLFNLN